MTKHPAFIILPSPPDVAFPHENGIIDLAALADAQLTTGEPVKLVLLSPAEFALLAEQQLQNEGSFSDHAQKLASEFELSSTNDETEQSVEDILRRTESEPVVRMAALIFDEAIKAGASDVHIEPSERAAVVRFRVDGMLTQAMDLTKALFTPVTSRIKIMANLDIAEKRAPQDGRIRYSSRGQDYDFRVSTLPIHWGEKTVVRILKHDIGLTDLVNLGMSPAMQELAQELINKPQGMIFVTGPTGSGKSSTLFACLNRIRRKAINITTIEDPIEYKMDGINQVQINEKAGVTFPSALRSILRQDPDVILVGEIRDADTATIAMQAAQTGHLVFSTLHTNDAVAAITRLRDLGVPGFLVASSVLAVVAQRLVRVLCPACRREGTPDPELVSRWRLIMGEIPLPPSWLAHGCEQCANTGYRGRTGLFELVTINEDLRGAIAGDENDTLLRRRVRQSGIPSLLLDGLDKVKCGVTTVEELLRVVLVEDAGTA